MEFNFEDFMDAARPGEGICPELDKCHVHYRNDGGGTSMDGTSYSVTYLDDLAVYSYEERDDNPESVMKGFELLEKSKAITTPEEKAAFVVEALTLLRDVTSAVSLVVRVGHGALTDVDAFGEDMVEEFTPTDGEDLPQLHAFVVARVQDGLVG